MHLTNVYDDSILRLLAKTAKTDNDSFKNRGWYVCDPTGIIYAHKCGKWQVGVDDSDDGFWPTCADAELFIADMKKQFI